MLRLFGEVRSLPQSFCFSQNASSLPEGATELRFALVFGIELGFILSVVCRLSSEICYLTAELKAGWREIRFSKGKSTRGKFPSSASENCNSKGFIAEKQGVRERRGIFKNLLKLK